LKKLIKFPELEDNEALLEKMDKVWYAMSDEEISEIKMWSTKQNKINL